MKTHPFFILLAGLVMGAAISIGLYSLFASSEQDVMAQSSADEAKPLYWVAPMDAQYKRDKPGKSPMGMDLVPVYAESSSGAVDEVGSVRISPDVINNLGVRTATVKTGRLQPLVRTVGYAQYDENRLVHISTRVEGWIEKLYIKAAGDPVKQGEPLYALYSPTLVNAQEELLLTLKRDNPVLTDAAVERLLALQVPQADIDRLRKTSKVSQTITITAPQSGVLDNLSVREGMFVKPSLSLMSIGQLEHIWMIGEVFERQASLVRKGDKVRMRLDYLPGKEWLGQVDYIYPSLNAKTRTAQVRVHFDNPDALLKPGMFAQLEIETSPRDESLLIPREALIRTGDQKRVVLALGEGKFKSVAVKVGHIGENQVEIRAGLNNNERIVTSAQFLIDSESSKTSDFMRMTEHQQRDEAMSEPVNVETESVWVSARIDSLMLGHRMVTLDHEAIPDWQWPPMTMDFTVAEDVDMDVLKQGMRLQVQISKDTNGDYLLTQVHIPKKEQEDQLKPAGGDSSQHQVMDPDPISEQRADMKHDSQDQKEPRHD